MVKGIDPNLRLTFWDYFNELNNAGTTIITTTHVMDEAEKSRLIGFLRAGKLIAEGTYQELRKKVPGHRKLVIITDLKDTNQLAKEVSDIYECNTLSQKYKLEIFYDDDSVIDNALSKISSITKIRSIQTVEPSLEDTFIFFSEKNDKEMKN